MLKKRWLLLGFPGGPTTEIQAWSVLELNFQKSCRKKLARVPPLLSYFQVQANHNRFCIFVISQNGRVPFCDSKIVTKWHIAILWFHKNSAIDFWKLVKSQNGTLPFCDFTKWHCAILWNHKNAILCEITKTLQNGIVILWFPKLHDSQNYEKNFWGWTSTTSTLKIAMIRSKVVVPRWMVKKHQSNHNFEGCSSMNLDGQV